MTNNKKKPFEKKELTLQLGDRVLFFAHLKRGNELVENPPGSLYKKRRRKIWKEIPISPEWNKSLTGVVVGIRTLSNGGVHYEEEAGNIFSPEEYFQAYMIVYNLHRKPVFVLPETLTKLSNRN